MKFIEAKNLKASVNKIVGTVKSLKTDAHLVAASCMVHVVKSRNPELINNLCGAMSQAAHNNAMTRWFDTYGKGVVIWDTKLKGFRINTKGCDVIESDDEAMANLKDTLENSKPYYELTKPATYVPFSLVKEVTRLVTKSKNKMEGEHTEEDDFTGMDELLKALAAIESKTSIEPATILRIAN